MSSTVPSSIGSCGSRDSVRHSTVFPGGKSSCAWEGESWDKKGGQSENSKKQTKAPRCPARSCRQIPTAMGQPPQRAGLGQPPPSGASQSLREALKVPESPTGREEIEMSGENRPKIPRANMGVGGSSDHVTKAYMMSPKASDKPVGLKGSKKGLGPAALAKTVSRSTSGDSETNKFRAQLNQCWALPGWRGVCGGGGTRPGSSPQHHGNWV